MKKRNNDVIPGALVGNTVDIMASRSCLGAIQEFNDGHVEVVNWLKSKRFLEISRTVFNDYNKVDAYQSARMQLGRSGAVTLRETDMQAMTAAGLVKLGESLAPYEILHPDMPLGVQSAIMLVDKVHESLDLEA